MATEGYLYTFRRCPYAIRARMAIARAGLDVEVREVLLSKKPAALLADSAKGTVPVLRLNDATLLEESLDIMHWALENSDPEGWLTRDTAAGERLVKDNDGAFKHWLDRAKYPERYGDTDPESARAEALQVLRPLEQRLKRQPHLLGDAPVFADVAIFPFVRQFAGIDSPRFAADMPSLERWRAHWADSNIFKTVMRKLAAWQPGDPVVRFQNVFR